MSTLNAVYDLSVSPPSYDFISFLCAAEKHRRDNAFDDIDLTFMPGPSHGFRSDNLPPDAETRDGMLWRVCVAMARLLPSIRNIHVQRRRYKVEGKVFPQNWRENNPVSHYGTYLFRDNPRCLTASGAARRHVKKIQTIPYVTFTMRESSYWPTRNSNEPEWAEAAAKIEALGFEVVWIPDTRSEVDTHPASWDIDLRAALYQQAVCNLGVSNGPMYLAVFLDAPYLIFRMIDPNCVSTTEAFLLSHGLKRGDQITPNGRLVWEEDKAATIVREFKQAQDR